MRPPVPPAAKLFDGSSGRATGAQSPQLGQMMASLMQGGGSGGGISTPPPAPGGLPPQMPGSPTGMPGAPPAMGGPAMQPGSPLGMSPEDMDLMMSEIEKEMKKGIRGQSGQQDQVMAASEGLGRYRPAQGPFFGPKTLSPSGMPEDVQYPPGMSPKGLQLWKDTGNPNPGMGRPMPMPPRPIR